MTNWFKKIERARIVLFSTPSRRYPFYLFFAVTLFLLYYYAKVIPDNQDNILQRDFKVLATASDEFKSVTMNRLAALEVEAEREKSTNWKDIPNVDQLNYVQTKLFVDCRDDGSSAPNESALSGQTLLRLTAQPTIRAEYAGPVHQVCVDIPVATVLNRMLEGNVEGFDSVAVALSDGDVIYQRSNDGFRLSNIGNFLEGAFEPKDPSSANAIMRPFLAPQNNSHSEAEIRENALPAQAQWREVSYTTLINAELENGQYKILIQPIPLAFAIAPYGRHTNRRLSLLLVGVVSSKRLAAAARSLPLSTISSLAVLLLLALLTLWPILKIWKMAPSDGFKKSELVWLSYSLLVSIALVTLLAINVLTRTDTEDIDRDLERLTDSIDAHTAREITEITDMIDEASRSSTLDQELKKSDFVPRARLFEDPKEESRAIFKSYPWFDQIFWTDPKGEQLVKWSVQEQTTRQTSIAGYEFYEKLRAGELWSQSESGSPTKFLLAPIYSPNTGEYIPLVLQVSNKSNLAGVGVHSQLLSLVSPILPPYFGFALVDEKGVVQFHSDKVRNGRENILRSMEPFDPLQRALTERGKQQFTAYYLNVRVRVHARPLTHVTGSPWILVTWYELGQRDRFVVDMLICTIFCLVVYFFYLGVLVCGAYVLIWKLKGSVIGQGDQWFLPSSSNLIKVWLLISAFLFLAMVNRLLIDFGTDREVWLGILLGPPVIIFGTVFVMTRKSETVPSKLTKFPALPKHSAIIAVSLAALLLGCMSTISFTRLSWDYVRVGYCQINAVSLAHSLVKRDHQIETTFQTVKVNPLLQEVAATDLSQRRWNEELDRYDLDLLRNQNINNNDVYESPLLIGSPECRPGEEPVICRFAKAATMLGARLSVAGSVSEIGGTWNAHRLHGQSGGIREVLVLSNIAERLAPVRVGHDLSIIAPLPDYTVPRVRTVGTLSFLSLMICGMIGLTLFYRFQWGYKAPPKLPAPSKLKLGHNKIILTCPWRSLDSELQTNSPATCILRIKLLDLLAQDDWQIRNKDFRGFLIILEFEAGLQSEELADKTLLALTSLEANREVTLVLISALDPLQWLFELLDRQLAAAEDVQARNETSRWLSVLGGFVREADGCLGSQHWTYQYCHIVWKYCTPFERLVLWQIANQGLPNPKNNRSLDHLIQRGLIVYTDTRFRIVSDGFKRFIRGDVARREIVTLFPPGADNAWRSLSRTLIYLFILIVLVVLVSLADWWGSSLLRLVTMGGAALPLLKTAFDAFPGLDAKTRKSV